jgi:CRISPR/Cas system CMR-associated protein Cmr5 small subunit
MKNLEQLRAEHALDFVNSSELPTGSKGGNILSKLPTMLVADGLLATAAFAKANGNGHEKLMSNLFKHLASINIVSGANIDDQIRSLTSADAIVLQRAASEAIAYANYIKRFGKSKVNKMENKE